MRHEDERVEFDEGEREIEGVMFLGGSYSTTSTLILDIPSLF